MPGAHHAVLAPAGCNAARQSWLHTYPVDCCPSLLQMPNLHFIPCVPVTTKSFDNDVYVATSEPHGESALELTLYF